MIDCEHSAGDYKSSKISFGVVMESPKLFKFIPTHLKTEKIFNCAVKKLL